MLLEKTGCLKDIRDWIAHWNDNPKPFSWTKTADEIFERLNSYLQRIPGAACYQKPMSTSTLPAAVFVHGAFTDASGFSGVIRELSSTRHAVVAPPNPLRSFAFDAAMTARCVAAIGGPVLLVGHCYGGAVIAQASATLGDVTGLVYLGAFGLNAGESCASVQQPFAPSLLSTACYPTVYDAPGAPRGPDLYLGRESSGKPFCAPFLSTRPM